jgi:hypothetical protein
LSVTMALCSACLLGSMGGWRGMVCVIDVANVELWVQNIEGGREKKKQQQSIVKGEVASSRCGG